MNVSFFSENVTGAFLETEIHPDVAQRFEIEYNQISGSMPVLGVGYLHQSNKWGGEYRVYFNCTHDLNDHFLQLGIAVEQGRRPYKKEWAFRVNNKDFFWALIGAGYRLGNN